MAVLRVSEETLRACGITARMTIAGHLDDLRQEAEEALEVARKNNESQLHSRLSRWIREFEDTQMELAQSEGER